MGRIKEVNPTEVRIFASARPGEDAAAALERIQPQRLPLTANIIDGSLEVEPGVVLELSGGIGVAGGELALSADGEILLGKEQTS